MRRPQRKHAFVAGILTLGLGLLSSRAVAVTKPLAEPAGQALTDCGVNSLFLLMMLEGKSISLDRIETALPVRHPRGYSMMELAKASSTLGLLLDGRKLTKSDRRLDRPAIAFLEDARGGHFAVVRPVGVTGTLVQVIDAPYAPRIVDIDRLFDSRQWTGRILIPRRPHYMLYWAACVAPVASISFAVLLRWRLGKSNARPRATLETESP